MRLTSRIGAADGSPMARRRAGAWARERAKERRRELIRKHRWPLARFAGVVVVIGVAAVALAGWLIGAWSAWFVAGAWYAAMVGTWLAAFELIDPVGRRWLAGAEGEKWTAEQLRRLRRRGWRVVHNVMLEGGDIDHVVIGPGGVVAVETKSPDAGWEWLLKEGIVDRWADQATRSAFRTEALVKQYAKLPIEVCPLMAVWATGRGAVEPVERRGCRVVHGRDLAAELAARIPTLTSDQVDQIHAAIELYARGLDAQRAGRRHAGSTA